MRQIRQRPGFDEAALPDDGDVVGQILDLRQDVAGQQDRGSRGDALADDCGELPLHERVEARRRFVEDQRIDVGRQRRDEHDLLAVALGVFAVLLRRVEAETLDQFGAHGGVVAAGIARAAGPEFRQRGQRLPAGELRPQGDVARNVRDACRRRRRIAHRVVAQDIDGAPVRAEHAEDRPDRRRLAGAVGAQEPVHGAPADREIQVIDRGERPEALGQAAHGDGGGVGVVKRIGAGSGRGIS